MKLTQREAIIRLTNPPHNIRKDLVTFFTSTKIKLISPKKQNKQRRLPNQVFETVETILDTKIKEKVETHT